MFSLGSGQGNPPPCSTRAFPAVHANALDRLSVNTDVLSGLRLRRRRC